MAMPETDLRHCVTQCLRCYETCFTSAMTYCLEKGGQHVEAQHFRLLSACAEICRSCAHILLLRSPLYRQMCHACAELCAQCAHNCDRLGDMSECAEACRRCADTCEKMYQA